MKLNIKDEISEEILNLRDTIKNRFNHHCNVNDFIEIVKFILQKKEWDSFDPFSAQNGLFYSYIVDKAYELSQRQDIDTQEVYQALKKFLTLSSSEGRELEKMNVDNVIAAIFLAIINFKNKNDRN